jgi:heme-degrading monooxygenase HmoA
MGSSTPRVTIRGMSERGDGRLFTHFGGMEAKEAAMIGRTWRGWTRPQNAEAYQRYLEGEILSDIRSRRGGFKGAYVLRREDRDQVEFLTLTLWDSMQAIQAVVGEDQEAAYLPDEERRLLDRFDERVVHYQVVLGRVADRPESSTDVGPSDADADA